MALPQVYYQTFLGVIALVIVLNVVQSLFCNNYMVHKRKPVSLPIVDLREVRDSANDDSVLPLLPSNTREVASSQIPGVKLNIVKKTISNYSKDIPDSTEKARNAQAKSDGFVKLMVTRNSVNADSGRSSVSSIREKCTEIPPNLGPISVNKTKIKLSSIKCKFPEVTSGGRYKPANCTKRHRVAIIIPFRDRSQHLAIFLNHMHPFLMRQQLDYGIFVIEQTDFGNFNRAKLFNVGFVEANRAREGGWQCYIFHDVDLLPMDDRNLYTCPRQPRHMSTSLDITKNKLSYETMFGGVTAMTYEQFKRVNGFSNIYWGWGGEDDDMSKRLRKIKYHIARYNMSIARYTMLAHKPQVPNPERFKLLSQTDENFKKDGLSNLEYELIKTVKHRLFTLVSVDIDDNS